MEEAAVDPHSPEVQAALVELARRMPGLTLHPGARGHGRHPFASGEVPEAGGTHLEVLRSVRWHEKGLALWLAAGPFGPWAKPIRPDVDHQEGGLIFLPDTAAPRPGGGLLVKFPESQRVLHDLWAGSKWEDQHGRVHDGLALLVRPDAIVAHVHASAVTADALEAIVRCLPDLAAAAEAHDAEWSTPIHPPRDQFVWPLLWMGVVAALAVVAYLAYLTLR